MFKKKPSNYIYKIREKNNLSQRELAEQLDVSQAFISKLEHDQQKPDSRFLARLRTRLKVNINKLIDNGDINE